MINSKFEINNCHISIELQESIEKIFDFWNSYKGQGNWKSHNKISFDIVQAIMENLKNYTEQEICEAISNYAKVLLDDEFFWTYAWPLSTFLTVKYEKRKEASKKWWQFLSNNFIEENYLKNGKNKIIVQDNPNPELIKKFINKYKVTINSTEFNPTNQQFNKFIDAGIKFKNFFKNKNISEDRGTDYLFRCLEKNYTDKGEVLHVGHLSSDLTWQILMPQYLLDIGGC